MTGVRAVPLMIQATSGSSQYDSPFQLTNFQFIDLSYGGHTLQMCPSQLTTSKIARAFWLIPDTTILVSERDGVFHDVDDSYTWTIEGHYQHTGSSHGREW